MTPTDKDLTRLMGKSKTCIVRESPEQKGSFEVLSPSVGLYNRPPAVGSYVKPGSFAGYLTMLNRYYHLLIPEGHRGIVIDLRVTSRKECVEYGQPLFSIGPRIHTAAGADTAGTRAKKEASEEGVPEGLFGLRSPTDGIFYRRPNPQALNYVEEGETIRTGTVLGLVEVMKCFNPIVYPGEPEFPPVAVIRRIIPGDTSEVRHGSLLFIVEQEPPG